MTQDKKKKKKKGVACSEQFLAGGGVGFVSLCTWIAGPLMCTDMLVFVAFGLLSSQSGHINLTRLNSAPVRITEEGLERPCTGFIAPGNHQTSTGQARALHGLQNSKSNR